jgi:glutamate dehydrogenase (NADP+)
MTPLEVTMSDDIDRLVESLDSTGKEFRQAVKNVFSSIQPVLDQRPDYQSAAIAERIVEPERMLVFRVPWLDDQEQVRVNRAFRVEMSSAIGPYKGGLRFHPSVSESTFKFLAFEQVFTNALTTLPLGGAAGGSNFDPKGKSDGEIMRFCQSLMSELFRHIGPRTDIPSGDIGVGGREIGYLFGMYRKLRNEFSGAITGKGLGWGGSLLRAEAAGYGCVYFAAAMLATRNQTLEGKTCLVSGSGKVAQSVAEKLIEQGAKVLTLSDSFGHIYDETGIDREKLQFVKHLKNVRREPIEAFTEAYPHAIYVQTDYRLDENPLWSHWADCVFPAATENEIGEKDTYNMINNRVKVVCEAANMPCTLAAADLLRSKKDILYAPAKAANAGGVAVAGLEMAQNSMRLSWTREEVDQRLKLIMQNIHQTCLQAAERYGTPGSYVNGANIAGFVKVADAMLDQGVI